MRAILEGSTQAWPLEWGINLVGTGRECEIQLPGQSGAASVAAVLVRFRFFECARVESMSRMGLFARRNGDDSVVPILASTKCDYKALLTYPGAIIVSARTVKIGRTRLTQESRAWSTAQACVRHRRRHHRVRGQEEREAGGGAGGDAKGDRAGGGGVWRNGKVLTMPELSRFFGIRIRMYHNEACAASHLRTGSGRSQAPGKRTV